MTETIARNGNYTGDDDVVARQQAQADGWLADIARRRREGGTTLTAEDRAEIIELLNLFEASYDALDRETWLSVYADGATFTSNSWGTARGHAELGAFFDNFTKNFTGKRHLITNCIVVGTPDEARMLSYLTVFERITGTQMLGGAVQYDTLRKVGGRWLFTDRQQVVDPGMNAGR